MFWFASLRALQPVGKSTLPEEQSVCYIDLSLCTSRESEVNMLKKEPALEFAADGSIKLAKKNKEAAADGG